MFFLKKRGNIQMLCLICAEYLISLTDKFCYIKETPHVSHADYLSVIVEESGCL